MTEKLAILWPEIFLFIATCLVMITGQWPSRAIRQFTPWICVVALLLAFFGAMTSPATQGMFPAIIPYAKMVIAFVGLLILLLLSGTVDRQIEVDVDKGKLFQSIRSNRGEFYAFFMFSLTGLMLTASADDLIWLFLALELTSLPTYIMVAMSRDEDSSLESAVKYFFLGALSAAIFLYGFALIYGATGTTDLNEIAAVFAADGISSIGMMGLLMAVIGVSFKIAAVPMHFYTPDVYQGAASPVSAMLAFVPKTAGFIALMFLLGTAGWGFGPSGGHLPVPIEATLWIMAALTMTVGNVLALLQSSVKRILAYSSIAHSGYMLVGIIAGPGLPGGPFYENGLAALLFYLFTYGVMTVGTFAVLAAAGFTINSLTMFATVLAIGLLVDDAIVVVENVERVMAEEGLSPKEATRKSMRQITGALIGIGLVLSAVFLPMAFFGGSTGVVYRQFSITIISAMALSVLVALIFTPALCSTVLKPSAHGGHAPRRGFFGAFNRGFDASNRRYQSGVQRMVQRAGRGMVIYLAIVVAMGWVYTRIPTAFLPDEDQGLMFLLVTAPPGAVSSRTEAALAQARDYLLNEEGEIVESVFTVSGFSFSGRGQNAGMAFVRLKDWAERPGAHNRVQALASRTPQRPVRRTSVQGRYRLGEGQRLRPDGQRHQQHAVCRMGIRVRQPVHRPRSRQAGFRSGRCAVTHESRRLRAVVRAQLGGRDGAVHGVFQRALGLRLTQARALQRHPFCADSWRAGAGLQHRRGNAGSRIADRKAAGGHRP